MLDKKPTGRCLIRPDGLFSAFHVASFYVLCAKICALQKLLKTTLTTLCAGRIDIKFTISQRRRCCGSFASQLRLLRTRGPRTILPPTWTNVASNRREFLGLTPGCFKILLRGWLYESRHRS